MSANLATKAFQVGLPKVTSAIAKWSPAVVDQAKNIYGMAVGKPAATVNLGQEASKNGGVNAQLVAESLVRAGAPVDKLFEGLSPEIDFSEIRAALKGIAIQRFSLSDKHTNGYIPQDPSSVDSFAAVKANNVELSRVMNLIGVNDIRSLFRLKVALETLTQDRVAKYLVDRPDGTPEISAVMGR